MFIGVFLPETATSFLRVTRAGSLSVLEVHHCNLAIEVLSDPQTNVFHSLTMEQQTYAFKALVNIILATDMAKHGDGPPPWRESCSPTARSCACANSWSPMRSSKKDSDEGSGDGYP